jgi:formate/nitrite transporter FocA (FNT family)
MAVIVGCKSDPIKITLDQSLTTVTDGDILDGEPYKEEIIAYATKKQITPEAHQIFIRAIGCNWLVCLACFLGVQAKDLTSKVIGMWIPVFAFVALGFDHVVANMFFIPLGIWMGTPGQEL